MIIIKKKARKKLTEKTDEMEENTRLNCFCRSLYICTVFRLQIDSIELTSVLFIWKLHANK